MAGKQRLLASCPRIGLGIPTFAGNIIRFAWQCRQNHVAPQKKPLVANPDLVVCAPALFLSVLIWRPSKQICVLFAICHLPAGPKFCFLSTRTATDCVDADTPALSHLALFIFIVSTLAQSEAIAHSGNLHPCLLPRCHLPLRNR